MDYKYIEQLLERYWQCETTLEEEGILRTFFGQKDIPAELRPYQALFAPQQVQGSSHRSHYPHLRKCRTGTMGQELAGSQTNPGRYGADR